MDDRTVAVLERIAGALERIAPAPQGAPDWALANAWMWATDPDALQPIAKVNRVEMDLLVGDLADLARPHADLADALRRGESPTRAGGRRAAGGG